jgi:hypothetical protein
MLEGLSVEARGYERKALQIRKFAGLSAFQRLDPVELAERLGFRVLEPSQVPGVSDEVMRRLLVERSNEWSGATSAELPGGGWMIVLNPVQHPQRKAATLMEEICHVLLGHRHDRLVDGSSGARDYGAAKEAEAYGVGAAALVPYEGLLGCVRQRLSNEVIASRYGVSKSLVEYRLKLVSLWDECLAAVAAGETT